MGLETLDSLSMDELRRRARAVKRLKLEREKESCEDSLVEFFKAAWPHMGEAGEPEINWHHVVSAGNLERIAFEGLKNLVINQPPRTTKSLLCSVAFPAWLWCQPEGRWGDLTGPHVRFLCLSYGATLAQDLAVKMRRLVMGEWYQGLWGSRVEIREDQSARENFATTKGGERLSYSVEGGVLGRGGDCVTGDTLVQTNMGEMKVKDLQNAACSLYILSYDSNLETPAYRRLVAVARRRSRRIWRVHTRDGCVVTATGDHKVFTRRGWVQAMALVVGDVLVRCVQAQDNPSSRRDGQVGAQSEGRAVLQPVVRNNSKKLGRGEIALALPCMRREVTVQGAAPELPVQRSLPKSDVSRAGGEAENNRAAPLRDLRQNIQTENDEGAWPFLLPSVPSQSALDCDERDQQSGVPPRPDEERPRAAAKMVPGEAGGMGPGRIILCGLRRDGDFRGPSHQPDAQRQSLDKFGVPLSEVSYGAPRGGAFEAEEDQVSLVEGDDLGEDTEVFDLQIEGTECFFANRILVHNCQIIDDPHHIQGAESETQRRATIEAMRNLVTRVTDPRRAARIMVMQRLHEDDATNYALENWDNPRHLMLPMRFDVTRRDPEDPRERDGQLLWPTVWTERLVRQEERELQEYGAAGQLQQSPVPRGGGIIKREWWRLWPDDADKEGGRTFRYRCGFCTWEGSASWAGSAMECQQCGMAAERVIEYPATSFRLLSVDTNYGSKEINSWSAATMWGVWHDADDAPRLMLMEAWRGRPKLRTGSMSDKGLVERIYDMTMRRNVDTVLIERKTRGQDLYDELDRLTREYPFRLEFFEPTGRGDKVARLNAVVPLFTNDLVWAPDKKWAELVISEVSNQPFDKFDDLADTCSSALAWMRANGHLSLKHEHAKSAREALFFRGRSGRFDAGELYEGA